MKLPIPETRTGWLVGIVLIIILLSVYYETLYEEIYSFYDSQYIAVNIPPFTICDEYQDSTLMDQKEQSPCTEQKWSLAIKIPAFTSYATPGWIYGKLQNEGDKEQRAIFSVNFSTENINLLPSMYKDDTFVRIITANNIPSGGTVYWRTEFGGNLIENAQECDTDLKNAFWLNGQKVPTSGNTNMVCPKDNVRSSLIRSAMESLLLPPWSNAFVPAIALFLCSLFEPRLKKAETGGENLFMVLVGFLRTLLPSLGVSFGLIYVLRLGLAKRQVAVSLVSVYSSNDMLVNLFLYILAAIFLGLIIFPLIGKILKTMTTANRFEKAKNLSKNILDWLKDKLSHRPKPNQ